MQKIKLALITVAVLGTSVVSFAQQNVGIGTTTPNSKSILELVSTTQGFLMPRMTTAQRLAIATVATDRGLVVYDTDLARVCTWTGASWDTGGGGLTGSGIATQVAFWTGASNLSSSSNLYWDNTNSRLGIGTAAPLSMVHIAKTGTDNYLRIDAGGTGSNFGGIIFGEDNFIFGHTIRHDALTNNLEFLTQDNTPTYTNRMTLTYTGNLGIGTSNPQQLLTLSNTTNPILRFDRSNGGAFDWEVSAGGLGLQIRGGADAVGAGLTDFFTLDGNGRLGLGNTTPSFIFDVSGTGGPRTRVMSQDNFWAGYLAQNNNRQYFMGVQGAFEAGDGTNSGFHIYDNTAGLQRMVIDYTGRVGINNFNPTERLDVVGNVKFSGALMPNNMTGTAGQVLTSTGAGAPVWANVASSGWGLTGNAGTVAGTNFIGTTDNVPFFLRVNNTFAGKIGLNSAGDANTAFGVDAFNITATGTRNSAFGVSSLNNNSSGAQNSAFGMLSLPINSSGNLNTAIGYSSLYNNSSGSNNTSVGHQSLFNNTANFNTALGQNSGSVNTTGSNNTFIGYNTNASANNLTNATAIGSQAYVSQSNSMVLGSINGVNGATSNTNVGIGTNAPQTKLEVVGAGVSNLVDSRITSYSNAASADYPLFTLARVNNNTVGTNTALLNNQGLGAISFSGANGTSIQPSAQIISFATQNWSGAGRGANLGFYTTQNNTTTSNLRMVVAENGWVGIGGVLTPLTLFTVGNSNQFRVNTTGNLIRVNDVPYSWPNAQGAAGTILTNDGSGNLSWVTASGSLPAGTSGQTLRHDGANWIANSNLFNNGTNIGIGTATPSQLLELVGVENSSIDLRTGSLTYRQSVNSSSGAQIGTVSGHTLNLFTSNQNRITILSGGNVGIGTTNPGERLDVNGNIRLLTTGGRTLLVQNAVGDGEWGATLTLRAGNAAGFGASAAGGGDVDIYAGNQYDGADNVSGGNVNIRGGFNTLGGLGVNDGNIRLFTGATERLTVTGNTGFVGIGTTVPSATLHVVGALRYVDGNQVNGRVLTSDANGNATWQNLPAGIGGTGSANKIAFWTGINTMSFNSQFHWDNSTERLGLGWSAPVSKLHMHIASTTDPVYSNYTNVNTQIATTDGFWVGIDIPGNAELRQKEALNMNFFTSDVQRMTIDNNGQVGINRSNPLAQTEIYGTSNAPTLSSLSQGNASVGTLRLSYTSGDVFDFGFQTTPQYAGWIQSGFGSTAEAILLNPVGGSVGIGTNNPSNTERLHVEGGIRFSGSLNLNGDYGTAGQFLTSNGGGTPSWSTLNLNSLAWGLNGNTGTIDGTHFIGTSDNVALSFRTWNAKSGRINPTLNETSFGYAALFSNTASQNTAFGSFAAFSNNIGGNNVAVGFQALYSNVSNSFNTAIGVNALLGTTVANNTALGYSAGSTNTLGTNNTYIGANANTSVNNLTNTTVIGANASVTQSNSLILGNNANVGIGTTAPASRFHAIGVVNTSALIASATPTLIFDNAATSTQNIAQFRVAGTRRGSMRWDSFGNVVLSPTGTGSVYLNQDEGGGSATAGVLIGNGAGGEVARFTNAGYLGIGNNNPFAPLHFANTTVNRKVVLWQSINNDHQFYGFGINAATLRYQVETTGANHIFYAGTSATTSNELMRITGTGRVGIGEANPLSNLHVVSNTAFVAQLINSAGSSTSDVLRVQGGSNTAAGSWLIDFRRPDLTQIGTVYQNAANSVLYNTTSDMRLKNIKGETNKGLNDLMKVKIYDYTYKDDINGNVITGFLAQDLYKVFPQSVTKPRNGDENPNTNPWMVDYGSVTPLIIKATQEQQQLIETLQSENADLKAKYEAQQKQIDELIKLIKKK